MGTLPVVFADRFPTPCNVVLQGLEPGIFLVRRDPTWSGATGPGALTPRVHLCARVVFRWEARATVLPVLSSAEVEGVAANLDPVVVRRFWAKVDRRAGLDGCWLWRGGVNPQGYGRVAQGSYGEGLAHRYALACASGVDVGGMAVRRSCAMKLCCNPLHLWLDDMPVAGSGDPARVVGGDDMALEVLRFHAAGFRQCDIASAFGVSPGYVSSLVNGRSRQAQRLGVASNPRVGASLAGAPPPRVVPAG